MNAGPRGIPARADVWISEWVARRATRAGLSGEAGAYAVRAHPARMLARLDDGVRRASATSVSLRFAADVPSDPSPGRRPVPSYPSETRAGRRDPSGRTSSRTRFACWSKRRTAAISRFRSDHGQVRASDSAKAGYRTISVAQCVREGTHWHRLQCARLCAPTRSEEHQSAANAN
jgi:hypothetical protein